MTRETKLTNVNRLIKRHVVIRLRQLCAFHLLTFTQENIARFISQRFSASWEKKSKTRFGFPRQYSTRSGIEVVTHLSVAYFLHYIAKTLRCRQDFVEDTFLADFTSLKISALTNHC